MPTRDNKDDDARSPSRRGGAGAHGADPPESLGGQATSFLTLIRPYRELATLVVGVIAAGLAAYTWTVSYFATQSQLQATQAQLQNFVCQTSHSLSDGANNTRVEIAEFDQDTNSRRLHDLLQSGTMTPAQITKANDLTTAITNDTQTIKELGAPDPATDAKCK